MKRENSFRYFSGAPKRLLIDNLKAAVGLCRLALGAACREIDGRHMCYGVCPQMITPWVSAEEFSRLVEASITGLKVVRISGPDRVMMYILSACTG